MFLDRYIDYMVFEKRFSTHTVEAYRFEVQQFEDYLHQLSEDVTSVNYHQLRSYFATLLESGRQPSSVNRSLSALRSYYQFLWREDLVLANPLVEIKALKQPKKLPVTVEAGKVSTLLDAEGVFSADFSGLRDRLVLEFLFGTGVRLSELLAVQMRDLDFYKKQVLIHGKRKKERWIPLTDTLCDLIKQYTKLRAVTFDETAEALILTDKGQPAYSRLIYRIVHRYLSLLSKQHKRSPHVMRHTFATSMLANGADLNAIKELLGHANLAATQVYTHNSAERLKNVYNQAHPRA